MASTNQAISRLRMAIPLESFSVPTSLTSRERVVLVEIVGGLSNKEMALLLDISPRTVEFHRANLLKKCGARNTADLVRKVLGD